MFKDRSFLAKSIWTLVSFFLFAFSQKAPAEGGMYLPMKGKLPAKEMVAIGLRISPEAVEKMANGTVARFVSPGCTTTFLSADGLLGTNWHCAEACLDAIQADARKERGTDDPLAHVKENGYVATSFEKELVCPGYMVEVPVDVKNVSAQFKDIESMKLQPAEREEKIRYRGEILRETCMKKDPEFICNVQVMNNEKEPYYLYRYRRLKDVRLVWSPPEIIGLFGGSTENWEYPRHTGDFSFLRVYQNGSKVGQPGNSPYHPRAVAKVSSKGVKPGDATFILGFPGVTTRNITSYAADFLQSAYLKVAHKVYGGLLDTLNSLFEAPLDSPYGSAWFYLQNFAENFEKKSRLMKELGVVASKHERETSLKDTTYLHEIGRVYRDARYFFPKLYLMTFMTGRASPAKSFMAAAYIWMWANQPADDKDRSDDRFKSYNKDQVVSAVKRVDMIGTVAAEKVLMSKMFAFADEFSAPVQAFEDLKARTRSVVKQCYRAGRSSEFNLSFEELCRDNKSIHDQMVDLLYAGSRIMARDGSEAEATRAMNYRLGLLEKTPEELARTNDLLVLVAKEVVQELSDLKSDPEYGALYTYELSRLNRLQNLMMGFDAPDANSTMRFTYSTVQEKYRPIYKKGEYPFCSTLGSMVERDRLIQDEKHQDYRFFLVPDYIKQAASNPSVFKGRFFYDEKAGDVPITFITRHLITGGNSGSSVFDANGEVVGFAFDGTPESIVSDVWIHPEMRTISVDIRYIGFLGDVVFPDAKRVLKELKLPVSK